MDRNILLFFIFIISTLIVLYLFYVNTDRASEQRIATQADVYIASFFAAALLVEFTAALFAASQINSPKNPAGRGDLG
jgi:hypothetical protein